MLVGTLCTRLLPWSARRWLNIVPPGAGRAPQFRVEQAQAGRAVITVAGDWRRDADQHALRETLADLLRIGSSVEFDLSAAPALDSALLGLMSVIDAWQVAPRAVRASTVSHRVLRADLHAYGAQHLIDSGG
jgi:hypothetical protein